MLMAIVPPNGVKICFITAFVQNIATAFAEFLLGLTLLDQVHRDSAGVQMFEKRWMRLQTASKLYCSGGTKDEADKHAADLHAPLEVYDINQSKHSSEVECNNNDSYDNTPGETYNAPPAESLETLGGIYQGQAATARNIGSLLASLFLLILLVVRGYAQEMSYAFAIFLLFLTGGLPLTGAVIAMLYTVGSRPSPSEFDDVANGEIDEQQDPMEADIFLASPGTTTKTKNTDSSEGGVSMLSAIEKATIATLQLLVIWIGLKGVISSSSLWLISFIILLSFLFLSILASIMQKRNQGNGGRLKSPLLQRSVALYLVLRHAMPEAAYQWYGYSYYLFSSKPIILQVLSLIGSAATTAGSYAYARYIAPQVKTRGGLVHVIGITTIIGTASSLLYLFVTVYNRSIIDPKQVVMQNFFLSLPIGVIASFSGEIRFLPSVALATSSVQFQRSTEKNTSDQQSDQTIYESQSSGSGLQYGTYVSCIDFGDQLGAWVTVPVVSALGITRGDWSNMTELILICAACGIGSLFFLLLLVPRRSETAKNAHVSNSEESSNMLTDHTSSHA